MATVLTPPAFRPLEPLPKRWTRDEYRKLIDDGYLTDGKCELIEGEIIEKMAHGRRHIIAVTRAIAELGTIFGVQTLQTQGTLYIGTASDPEPDVAVLTRDVGDFLDEDPGPDNVHLLVEVSDSSLRLDMNTKSGTYARAGIPEYWVVNINARTLEVFRQPGPQGYAEMMTLQATESVRPLAAPTSEISVADLLP
ncbi:MAG: Uma2 family endonuclease [Armatimonadota bacterium]|nr:Uma2 family endonuclease [Armatimonadota bacterium]